MQICIYSFSLQFHCRTNSFKYFNWWLIYFIENASSIHNFAYDDFYLLGIEQKQPSEVFYEKHILRNSRKFTGTHLCQSLFFNKDADLRFATLLKKRLWHSWFPVNFAKFLRTPILQNTSGRQLLLEHFRRNWITRISKQQSCQLVYKQRNDCQSCQVSKGIWINKRAN